MYIVKFTKKFKKSYKLMLKRRYDISLLDNIIDALRQGKNLNPKYHDHILTGNFTVIHECHIKPNRLLLYLIEDDILTLTCINTGSHTDILD